MTSTSDRIRAHYDGPALLERIKLALPAPDPEAPTLAVTQLAALDQFHIRGLEATAELAGGLGLQPGQSFLDLGCGIGGPARYVAAAFGCRVIGVDLSPSFIEAAKYLTSRCGLTERVEFLTGDALNLPVEDDRFDHVLLQHVAMNINDHASLYREVARVLKPGGRFATYDVVALGSDVIYPVPWARDATTSFLQDASSTRRAIEAAGFRVEIFRDDTPKALAWFEAAQAKPPSAGPNFAVVMGSDFPALAGNLARNLQEGRISVLFAVFARD